MHPILERLRQRKIVQWALAYAAGAGVLYSTLDGPLRIWGITDGQLRIVQVLLVVGFFLALTLAWYHGERGEQRVSGVELLILAGIMGLGAIGIRVLSAGVPSARPDLRAGVRITTWDGSPESTNIGPADAGYLYRDAVTLWYRPWDQAEAMEVPGASEGFNGNFWLSPNGRLAVYGASGKKYVVQLPDGVPREVPAAAGYTVMGIDDSGSVYFGDVTDSLSRAQPGDEHGRALTDRRDGEIRFGPVRMLPSGHEAVFSVFDGASWTMWLMDIVTGARTEIGEGEGPGYAPGGFLVYRLGNRLVAARFDSDSGELTTVPVTVASNVINHHISPDGTLAYIEGVDAWEMVWVRRTDGLVEPVDSGWTFDHGRQNGGWRLSPDGRRVAFRNRTATGLDVWVADLVTGARMRLTRHPAEDRGPRWTAGGDTVTFLSDRNGDGRSEVWARASDGSGEPSLVIDPPREIAQGFWGPGSQWLFLRTVGGIQQPGGADILVVGPNRSEPAELIADPGFDEAHPALSPDGGTLAYMSNETGTMEIYIRPFPDVQSARWQVSSAGGFLPIWSRDGTELYYLRASGENGVGEMVAAELDVDRASPIVGERVLFTVPLEDFVTAYMRDFFDVTPDGERFLMVRSAGRTRRTVIVEGFATRLPQLVGG